MPTLAQIKAQDDKASDIVIDYFKSNSAFLAFAKKEAESIVKRDNEDDEKLAKGIQFSVNRNVIPASPTVEPITRICVENKPADAVAQEIARSIGQASESGCVVVLQGLSGTGKGTTVSKLAQILPNSTCWSNGNIFRALTLLTASHCAKEKIAFSESLLTTSFVANLMSKLSFDKAPHGFDIRIEAPELGLQFWVAEIAKTKLTEPAVVSLIPTVAQYTQGEVVTFATQAFSVLINYKQNVIVEGRAATLAYIRTPYRFELCIKEMELLGKRRAAQRILGKAVESLKGHHEGPAVDAALKAALKALSGEAGAQCCSCPCKKLIPVIFFTIALMTVNKTGAGVCRV